MFGNLVRPLAHSVLYLRVIPSEAIPKDISGRTSYLRVRLEFLRYPQLIRAFFNRHLFGPPPDFTQASTCPWVGHPVSGLLHATLRPIQTRSRFGSVLPVLNLAAYNNSPDRSTKSTPSHFNVLRLLVNTGFQILFHSPPGVLFTFPSRYSPLSVTGSYLALGGGPPAFPQDSSCLVVLRIPASPFRFAYRAVTFFGGGFHSTLLLASIQFRRSLPQTPLLRSGLGSSAFARHYLRNHFCFLFLRVLRCFSSPRLTSIRYGFTY